jgi:diguanylate cyclase (GGDEF)-like protein
MIPRDRSSRRIAAASAIVVVLLAGATGVTIWRYEQALDETDKALQVQVEDLRLEQAATFFWRERETMNEYLLTPSAQLLDELASEHHSFDSVTSGLGDDQPREGARVKGSQAANRAFLAVFRRIRHLAGRRFLEEAAAISQLNGAEEAVLRPLEALQASYETEVRTRRAEKAGADVQALVAALLGAVLAMVATIGLAFVVMRLLADMARRRAADRALEASQTEFAEMLQVTEAQDEAYDLLNRQIERSVSGGRAIVLNRNNSENRLEATTVSPPESDLIERLKGAEPRACLAVRFGRRHVESLDREPLVRCALCAGNSGRSTCEPLLVGGEVIGSALVMHPEPLTKPERTTIAVSLAQAGPVLANLRNLAIAKFRAATDALTGLPNNRAVQDTIKRMVAQASRNVSPLAALLLDLDHFKQINDTHGHGRGDEVLSALGATLEDSLRDSDFVGRYGGEEFVILLPATGREDALVAAEKVRAAVEAITVPGVARAITASIGVAVMPDDAGESVALLRHADRRLYAAKAKGRNRVVADDEADPVALSEGTEADRRTGAPSL